jgi:SAM-dependent methyltransferase
MERERNGRMVRFCVAAVLVAAACSPAATSPPPSTGHLAGVSAVDEQALASAESEVPERRDCTGPLTFDDEKLERAVRKEISKPDGAILPAEVQEVSGVNVSQSAVTELGLHGLNAVHLLDHGGLDRSSRVLEVGCGTGNCISAIQDRVGCPGWGIDPSARMQDRSFSALRLISAQEFWQGFEWLRRDLEAGPVAAVSRYVLVWAATA